MKLEGWYETNEQYMGNFVTFFLIKLIKVWVFIVKNRGENLCHMRFNINLTACDMSQTVALTLRNEASYEAHE